MTTTKQETRIAVAAALLEARIVELRPAEPFTWASGWKSPIYCDNRKTLSVPTLRSYIKKELTRCVVELFPAAETIAGVATGAIAQGALVADATGKPFVYVRSKAKDHGMGNLIEGEIAPGTRVVVVEDLISTGGSSLRAVEALRSAGCIVEGMVATFTYGFDVAREAFEAADVPLYTLTDYAAVLQCAAETGYIAARDIAVLSQWRKNPAEWGR